MKIARRRRLLSLSLAAALAASAGWLLVLPDVGPLRTRPPETTAYIELRRAQARAAGRPFAPRWSWTPYERIADGLKEAVVVAEDDAFWRHSGVDWDALRAAGERDWKERRPVAGASTITMQLARNLYLSPSKNPLRKLKEMLIARRLERELGKRRILELYLNVVEWGKDVFGCEAAAQAYFGKSCADLTRDEALAMAVVLPNPRRWDPARRGPYVERNARRVLERILASGIWTPSADEAAVLQGPQLLWSASQSTSTSVNSSTGSVENDQGRKPDTLE